jgi:hypothetical protein
VQRLLEVIAGREFKHQVTALGGYDVRDTGRVMAHWIGGRPTCSEYLDKNTSK